VHGAYTSVQVNVDVNGDNILGDAANEPSIAIDPTNPARIVIGWRQFDTVESSFRQAGYGYSTDAGRTWTFGGVMHRTVFGSDPVLDAGPGGRIYYSTLLDGALYNELYESLDGGVTWGGVLSRYGRDKPWFVVDRTDGSGAGNLYAVHYTGPSFWRSSDNGRSFDAEVELPVGHRSVAITVGPHGQVLVLDWNLHVVGSENARDPNQSPMFQALGQATLPFGSDGCDPNPGGLSGFPWIAVNPSDGPFAEEVYVVGLGAVSEGEDTGVALTRSTDGGHTWSPVVRINDDLPGSGACQWFPTMSVAPNGRLDAVWNDTRNSGQENISQVFYSSSVDGGRTWSPNVALTPSWDSWIGWPRQNKIGDYYHMRSDDVGASLAYAATFNSEQDVYFLRIGDYDCNGNGVGDADDLRDGTSADCNANNIPDECEPDCNGNGIPDDCDVASGRSEDRDGSGYPDECELLYVDASASGANDGRSWADAFVDLQDALLAMGRSAVPRVEVRVAGGVYRPDRGTGEKSATFSMPPGITVRGGYAPAAWGRDRPRDPSGFPTVLSGDLAGNNSSHVVTVRNAILPVTLDGLTVRAGDAGGVGAEHTKRGGGVVISGGTAEITNCTVCDNKASLRGAGLFATGANVVIRRCRFADNTARQGGGAIAVWEQAHVDVFDSLIESNEAEVGGGVVIPGDGSARISRTTITSNHATSRLPSGGGVDISEGVATFDSSIVWGNHADSGDESEQQVYVREGQVTARYSCIPGAAERFGGEGNFGDDPRFVDRPARDYRLLPDSPCIDAGDPADVPPAGTRDLDGRPRLLSGRIDVGAYEFGFGDYNGDRIIDLVDYQNWTVCATGPDQGPYPAGCEAFDGDADGDVDLVDFVQLQVPLGGS
jgi:hypothetical protein